MIFEEFFNFLFQNLFINIDDRYRCSSKFKISNFCLNTYIKLLIHVAFYNTSSENFKSRDESVHLGVKGLNNFLSLGRSPSPKECLKCRFCPRHSPFSSARRVLHQGRTTVPTESPVESLNSITQWPTYAIPALDHAQLHQALRFLLLAASALGV